MLIIFIHGATMGAIHANQELRPHFHNVHQPCQGLVSAAFPVGLSEPKVCLISHGL